MLQQTQVDRVIPKYRLFLTRFPTLRALARAPAGSVLKVWQGLGYNRRALMLHRCAREVVARYRGVLPDSVDALKTLPGIGPYTAGAVLAFAFNTPHPIIETNIRRVYLHHYFADRTNVADEEILPIIERTLDRRNPRRWFWALMDYGSFLASQIPNPNRRSKHYGRQSTFEGSHRQLRGEILRQVLTDKKQSVATIARNIGRSVREVTSVMAEMAKEGFFSSDAVQ